MGRSTPTNVAEVVDRVLNGLRLAKENRNMLYGLGLFLGMYLAAQIGRSISPYKPLRYGDVAPNLAPSFEHFLGTDPMGRDIATQLVNGIVLSIQIGIFAGLIAFAAAVLIAVVGGYYGGMIDSVLSLVTEVFITIPTLVPLILVAALVPRIDVLTMSSLLAVFSWAWPAKVMRAQVLSLKERRFVDLAKTSGYGGFEIIVREIMPNMLPFMGAYFANVVSQAMMSEAGLEVIGLGPQHTVTLGVMLNWSISFGAIFRGIIAWWISPAVMLILIFVSLFLISMGLDEISNPRLRTEREISG